MNVTQWESVLTLPVLEADHILGPADAVTLWELTSHVHAAKVREDFLSGVRSGVNGTPTFFINGVRYDGSHDLEALLAAVGRAAA